MSTAPAWSESIAPDEQARFDKLAAKLKEIQLARAERQPLGRGLHHKAHGGLKAELRTTGDGPAWSRVGIFASAGRYAAYARFSNGSGLHQPDKTPDVRGLAVKVVGVPGRKLIPGMEDERTQDFLAILAESVPFHTPEEFVGLVVALSGSPLLALPRLLGVFGFSRLLKVLGQLKQGLSVPFPTCVGRTFFSALPIRWGETAVKYSFEPINPPAAQEGLTAADAPDGLARDLAAQIAAGPLRYALRVQPYVDPQRTPIEDATVAWDTAASPWTTVGELTILKQDVHSEEGTRIATAVERWSFDPWHAPEEFRPLGALMRARAPAYRDSAIARGAGAEPNGSETWV